MGPEFILSQIPGFTNLLNNNQHDQNDVNDVNEDKDKDEDKDEDKFVCTKYTKSDKNYRIIHYDKSVLSTDLIETFGLARSIIINSLGQVVCFSPPKSLPADMFIQSYPYPKSETSNIVAEEFIEGTMINVFWDPSLGINGSFEIATRNTVGADVGFYMPSYKANTNTNTNSSQKSKSKTKTFKSMFLEACEITKIDINLLNKDYCYSFVLQHPDNRIVVPFIVPSLYLVAVYKIVINVSVENACTPCLKHGNVNLSLIKSPSIGDLKVQMCKNKITVYPMNMEEVKSFGYWKLTDIKFPKIYTGWPSYSDLIDTYASPNTPYHVLGVVIHNLSTGMRCKIRNPIYEEVRQLRGNQPKSQFQYLTLRQQGKVCDFLKFYPEFKKEFSLFRDQMHLFTNNLYRNYISCYIKKEKPLIEFPVQYRTHMFKIHQQYINDLKPQSKYVTNTVVIEFMNKMPPAHQMHSLNYNIYQHDKDTQLTNKQLL